VRAAIVRTVAGLGGGLASFKKAVKFEYAAPRMNLENYALITDGREARPCVQALTQACLVPPTLMVVLSEQPKHAERLVRWARGLRETGFKVPVFVINGITELGPILCQSELPIREDMESPPNMPAVCLPVVVGLATSQIANVSTTTCLSRPVALASTSPASMAPIRRFVHCGDATRMHAAPVVTIGSGDALAYQAPRPVTPSTPFLFDKRSEGVSPEVLQALFPPVPSNASAGVLERLLAHFSPGSYDE